MPKSCLQRLLSPSGYFSGSQVLKLVLYFEVMGLLYKFVVSITQGLRIIKTEIPLYELVFRIIIFIKVFLVDPIILFLLWTGINLNSKNRLQICSTIKMILFIPTSASFLISYNEHLKTHEVTFSVVLNFLMYFMVVGLYALQIYILWKYYHQLDSQIISIITQGCSLMGCGEVSKNRMSLPGHNIQASEQLATEIERIHEIPKIEEKQLKQNVISPWDLIIDKNAVLGHGHFGIVYQGTYLKNKTRIPVAVKVIKNPESSLEVLMKEIKIMFYVGMHKNIVKFYGISSNASEEDNFSMIMERCRCSLQNLLLEQRYVNVENKLPDISNVCEVSFAHTENGSALQEDVMTDIKTGYINLGEKSKIELRNLLLYCSEIAQGMEYLAGKKVVHGDLATRNILLTEKHTVKITDFGIANRLYDYQIYFNSSKEDAKIPWRWTAIEGLEDLKFSEKSDVWSYGVLLWEIFTIGACPYVNLTWSLDIVNKLRNGLCLEKPFLATDEIYSVMKLCWNLDPSSRPSFTELKQMIKTLQEHHKNDFSSSRYTERFSMESTTN